MSTQYVSNTVRVMRDNGKMDLIYEIESYREKSGLGKADMARIFGVPEQNYNNWTYRGSLPKAYYERAREILAGGRKEEAGAPPSKADYVLIPQYLVKGGCGGGYLNDHVEVNGGLAFKREWIKRAGVKPESLYVIYADGSSMEPYIFEGDVVLFDTSTKEPRDRGVYAIRRPDGGISIKRLVRQLSGSWLVRSDNPDKACYPDEPVSETVLHELPILGRVIWRGGGIG